MSPAADLHAAPRARRPRERPIIFGAESVLAILEGRKTQTRRVVKPQPAEVSPGAGRTPGLVRLRASDPCLSTHGDACPYGKPGDRLWVRETWQLFDPDIDPISPERFGARAPYDGVDDERPIRWTTCYASDGPLAHPTLGAARWRSPIFMPRWASRITLEILRVRVERLHEIDEEDACAEGVGYTRLPLVGAHGTTVAHVGGWPTEVVGATARDAFAIGWDSINGKRAPWSSNPWVWVLEFKRVEAGDR